MFYNTVLNCADLASVEKALKAAPSLNTIAGFTLNCKKKKNEKHKTDFAGKQS